MHHHTTTDNTTATSGFPVDSATRACCGGIGQHTRTCSTVPVPPGCNHVEQWDAAQRYIAADLFGPVSVWSYQRHDGTLADVQVFIRLADVQFAPGQSQPVADHFRRLARTVAEADELAQQWQRWTPHRG
ncbi:hypothetical protein [Mycobacterium sp. SMC-4]|uniref:hypothetical protein n=1 Tax=Mycobacterium sp. SMC-4 TaxID=2857059 RepID=UPI0021B1B241|nr:hypothetical protein [Mycobacterium sp. SMC-4]UXA16970.1 hypothetical protein KXD98_19735 [Mycobacterium sp. SMC-4]